MTPAAAIAAALQDLRGAIADRGIPFPGSTCVGLRRLDVAADLWTESSVEGLALLKCVAGASLGAAGKLAAYRSERCVESVLVKVRAGRTTARVYDKGGQSGVAPRGRWLRFEAQWRLPREARPAPEGLDGAELRRRFPRGAGALAALLAYGEAAPAQMRFLLVDAESAGGVVRVDRREAAA